jgi:type I restriction enzyme S subunit
MADFEPANVARQVEPLRRLLEMREKLRDLQAKVDRLKALQAQTAAELDALLPAVLDRAFKGEL